MPLLLSYAKLHNAAAEMHRMNPIYLDVLDNFGTLQTKTTRAPIVDDSLHPALVAARTQRAGTAPRVATRDFGVSFAFSTT